MKLITLIKDKVMTKEERQEERELLLNALKDGLPYGLQLQITDVNEFTFNGELCVLSKNWCKLNIADPVKMAKVKNQTIPLNYIYIKPYLRPMSSMTEEERKEHNSRRLSKWSTYSEYCANVIDWLLKNHFDFNGLIPKNLAIAVTEQNNPYKIE